MKIMKQIRGINNMSMWAKALIVVCLALILVRAYNAKSASNSAAEGFDNNDITNSALQILEGPKIYDGFYSSIYDSLTYFHKKNEFEMGAITKLAPMTKASMTLDIGSGTGHHVAQMKEVGAGSTMGIDNSPAMIAEAKKKYPGNKYVLGDAMQSSAFRQNTFTHITMFYFTVYYFQDKAALFANCFAWLKPGGTMVVHVVDKEMFDPILPPANPLVTLTPQRYAKQRITTSKITFDDFKYDAEFVPGDGDNAEFVEKFTQRKGENKVFRKNKHRMYMDDMDKVESAARGAGFIVKSKMDMIKAEYEYQYLLIFQKPE